MDVQFDTNEQHNNCSQRGEQDTGRVKPFVCRRREQVRYGTAKYGADDAEHDRPENGHVHVHDRLGDDAGNQPDDDNTR